MCIDVSKADISGSNCFITAELGGGAIYTSCKGNVVVRMCLWPKKLLVHVQPDRHAVSNTWKKDLCSLVLGNSQSKQCSNYYLALLIPFVYSPRPSPRSQQQQEPSMDRSSVPTLLQQTITSFHSPQMIQPHSIFIAWLIRYKPSYEESSAYLTFVCCHHDCVVETCNRTVVNAFHSCPPMFSSLKHIQLLVEFLLLLRSPEGWCLFPP